MVLGRCWRPRYSRQAKKLKLTIKFVKIIGCQYVSRSAAVIFVASTSESQSQPQRGGNILVIIIAPLGLVFFGLL